MSQPQHAFEQQERDSQTRTVFCAVSKTNVYLPIFFAVSIELFIWTCGTMVVPIASKRRGGSQNPTELGSTPLVQGSFHEC